MTTTTRPAQVEKLEFGIPGFDAMSHGGLPKGRTTLVSGTAGSAKTVLAVQFLAEGISQMGQSGVFVTFEETPDDIRRNMLGFGWDVQRWEEEGKWAFVDASPELGIDTITVGSYDLGALTARIENAASKVDATRVCIDSLGAIFSQFDDRGTVRRELLRIVAALKIMGVTALITSERTNEYGEIGRFGVEEFVADDVIILRNVLTDEKRRRTLEILKFRGTTHDKGEHPFTVLPGQGIVLVPLSAIDLDQKSSTVRIPSGIPQLDDMCHGGFFRDSIILVSGATGCGKTLMSTQFAAGGFANDERCLFFAFEESAEQLRRNAEGWGVDFGAMEASDNLKLISTYPETAGLEDHLIHMKDAIAEFKPNRVALDSLSALERVTTEKSFREFVIGLSSFIKQQEIAGLFTSTTPSLLGGSSVTEAHISTITDSIILLRYVESFGEMLRGITVLKMRGSMHDKSIREYSIGSQGMVIGKPFRNVSGILAGNITHTPDGEMERVSDLFQD